MGCGQWQELANPVWMARGTAGYSSRRAARDTLAGTARWPRGPRLFRRSRRRLYRAASSACRAAELLSRHRRRSSISARRLPTVRRSVTLARHLGGSGHRTPRARRIRRGQMRTRRRAMHRWHTGATPALALGAQSRRRLSPAHATISPQRRRRGEASVPRDSPSPNRPVPRRRCNSLRAAPATLYHAATLRGGQALHHDGNIVVVGDVNPGAELVAGGDVLVFGRLAGVAHAGAQGDENARVLRLDLDATQLRIATFIAADSDVARAERGGPKSPSCEMAQNRHRDARSVRTLRCCQEHAIVNCRRIVVTSGKGGVGKTTTTANLGAALAKRGKRVILVDADIGLRNLDLVLGLEKRIVFDLVEVAEGRCQLRQALIKDKRFESLSILAGGADARKRRDNRRTVCGDRRDGRRKCGLRAYRLSRRHRNGFSQRRRLPPPKPSS